MKSWLLLALFSALCVWAATRGQGVRYEPATAEEQAIADECESNLTSRDKYSVSLIRYTIRDGLPVSLVETDAPNTDPYLENCTTINLSSNSSSNDSIRSIVRLDFQNVCHDVLFLADDGSPVVCGYNQIFAVGKLDYQPRTEEERSAETRCKHYLPHPHSTRPTLIEYEADPEGKFPGYFLRNTTHLPDDGNPFREDCANIFTPGDGEIRPVISITQTGTCHDVLFFANGKNPVVCLYVTTSNVVHGGEGAVYRPTTADEKRYEDQCKERLPGLNRYDITLRRYTLREGQTSSLHKTDTANSDTFIEDCDSVGVSDFSSGEYRDILFLVNGTSVTCHDVLFLFNNTDPVVCYYQARTAKPLVDYEPRNPEEEEIDRRCKETLPRLANTRMSLVKCESNPNGAFPGYTQCNVTYNNTQDDFRENCTLLFHFLRVELNSVNETRPIILISESLTCHDVLFYSRTDPVVCLYIIPHNVEIVVHKIPAVIVLVFTSLSVIASTVLMATHFICEPSPTRGQTPSPITFIRGHELCTHSSPIRGPVSAAPPLNVFMENVAVHARTKWRFFGIMIDIPPDILDSFPGHDCLQAFSRVYDFWLRRATPIVSWEMIASILESDTVDEKKLADDVRRNFAPSVIPQPTILGHSTSTYSQKTNSTEDTGYGSVQSRMKVHQ